jgi:hypothetical protein
MLGDALVGAAALFTAEITPAITAAAPIAIPVLAFFVGWRIFRRVVKG